MMDPATFIDGALARGFQFYTGVPCSYLTPLINCTLSDERLRYVAAANEGDAVALAAGAAIGGQRGVVMLQNSGLGNAVSPLTSLAYTFRIPMLVVTTLRGAPGTPDEPQHHLMGAITLSMLDTMRIPWRYFPDQPEALEPTWQAATDHIAAHGRPYALAMKKDTLSDCDLAEKSSPPGPPGPATVQIGSGTPTVTRAQVLARLIQHTPVDDTVLIATTGHTGRELYAIDDRPNQLYMVGSMGCAPSLGLGLALTQPNQRTIVIDGDGAAMMRMGNLATIGAYGGDNLIHLVLDNGRYDSTGGQATVSAGISFAGIARACGYGATFEGTGLELIDAALAPGGPPGPRLVHLRMQPGVDGKLPRPTLTPAQTVRRLARHLGTTVVQSRGAGT